MRLTPSLPIDEVLNDIKSCVQRDGSFVLQAPPGAGKTTRVPLFLEDQQLFEGKLLMLEPRRVAARAAAERLAQSIGERPGGKIGYRMRGESIPGARIEVVTEGILTRMIQSDPSLEGIGCILFDEFHERSLHADLGLALCLEVREALRPDLVLGVMSATLDAEEVAKLLGAEIVTSTGRAYEVETRWLDRPWRKQETRHGAFERAMTALIEQAFEETSGGILAFLPGAAEITKVAAMLDCPGATILPLFGALPFKDQQRALAPAVESRKIVLATSIAETSVTIPDVVAVVDGGLSRRARFDPSSGMSRLVTEKVTRAEAEQRRGRTGRVQAGTCYRLWTKGEEGSLAAYPPVEIEVADPVPLALELALWGSDDLRFLTPPPQSSLAEARTLLHRLQALDDQQRITKHGRELAGHPLHPRLAHMLVAGGGSVAAELAAILEMRRPDGIDSDEVSDRLRKIRESREPAWTAARKQAARLKPGRDRGASIGELLSLAYPDRIGLRREGSAARYLLSGGKGAALQEGSKLVDQQMIVAAELDGDPTEAKIRLAEPVTKDEIASLHSQSIRPVRFCRWSRRQQRVEAREQAQLDALVLEDRAWNDVASEDIAQAAAEGIRLLGLDVLDWGKNARMLRARIEFARAWGAGDLPDVSSDALLGSVENWLGPYLGKCRNKADFDRLDPFDGLRSMLDWNQLQMLDQIAPETFTAPTGTRCPIDYSGDVPGVSIRLQELYGLTRHPLIGKSQIALQVELLSPAGRAVQITRDLPGFWQCSYADVRKDMRGRYPKHFWPEDPASAEPTRRVKAKKD